MKISLVRFTRTKVSSSGIHFRSMFKSSVLYRIMLGFRVSARFDERDRENQNILFFLLNLNPPVREETQENIQLHTTILRFFSFTTIKLIVLTGR